MKNTILVQGAMEVELKIIKENILDSEEVIIDGFKFVKGKLGDYNIVLSQTNIGTINAALATLIGIKEFKPIFIINQGVAGGTQKDIHKGDLVIGKACVNVNSYETKQRNYGEGSAPLEWKIKKFTSDDENEDSSVGINADNRLVEFTRQISYENGNVHYGILGSGDVWNKEVDRIIWLNEKLNTISADMESIGAYSVASKYNVPIVGIRVISDNVLVEENYERNVAQIVQEYVVKYIKEIISKENICKLL